MTTPLLQLAILVSIVIFVSTAPLKVDDLNAENHTQRSDLFEGDIKIPVDMIIEHYNFSSIPGGEKILLEYLKNSSGIQNGNKSVYDNSRHKRDAGHRIKLWLNKIVRYKISSEIPRNVTAIITKAIKNIEDNTCLQFLSVSSGDHIYFTDADKGCYSSYIGRRGGQQIVNLESPRCTSVGIIMHEIMHAIGFWHEQSRPDRDLYVRIHNDNINETYKNNFLKRNNFDVDYQGSAYDYGSIMHYGRTYFKKKGCRGSRCTTISVSNSTEYRRQGRPSLGQRVRLSNDDVLQINRLYGCPKPGIKGFLTFQVKRGFSLRGSDGLFDAPDPFVYLQALDAQGTHLSYRTATQQNKHNPVWYEIALFGYREWQFFKICSYDSDLIGVDQLTMSQTIPVERGYHRDLKNCENATCGGYVTYDYNLDTRVMTYARLQVYIRFARNLLNTDLIGQRPDPYVRVMAIQSNAVVQTRRSGTKYGSTSPTWYQWIDFGCQTWNSIFIQVLDSDIDDDDRMSNMQWWLVNLGRYSNLRHPALGNGYLIFDYYLRQDGNECSPNPCRNGGTCRDGCSSYTCTCRYGFSGANCQYFTGNLRVKAKYGRSLQDKDIIGDSDPYIEFIATDVNGNTIRRTTNTRHGNHNPSWNQNLYFGYRAWSSLKIQVFDADPGSDDALSNQQTLQLFSRRSRSNVRHNCHSGYVVFDYSY